MKKVYNYKNVSKKLTTGICNQGQNVPKIPNQQVKCINENSLFGQCFPYLYH